MDPDDVVRIENFHERITKDLVDMPVLLPKARLINGERGKIMKQWPNGRIAKSEIKLLHLFFGKKNRIGPVGRQRLFF